MDLATPQEKEKEEKRKLKHKKAPRGLGGFFFY